MKTPRTMSRLIVPLFALMLGAQAQAAPEKPADEVIRSATTEFQTLIRENHEAYRKDLGAFYEVVDEKVVPYFDTRGIAQLVRMMLSIGQSSEPSTDTDKQAS